MYKYISDTEIYFSSENTVEHWGCTLGMIHKYFIILFVMYVSNSHFESWRNLKSSKQHLEGFLYQK